MPVFKCNEVSIKMHIGNQMCISFTINNPFELLVHLIANSVTHEYFYILISTLILDTDCAVNLQSYIC